MLKGHVFSTRSKISEKKRIRRQTTERLTGLTFEQLNVRKADVTVYKVIYDKIESLLTSCVVQYSSAGVFSSLLSPRPSSTAPLLKLQLLPMSITATPHLSPTTALRWLVRELSSRSKIARKT